MKPFYLSSETVLPIKSNLSAFQIYNLCRYVRVRKRKWTNYASGEELFGLSITQYPGGALHVESSRPITHNL